MAEFYTLEQLVRSSANVISKHGKSSYSMSQALIKDFGTIYYNNKVVIYNEDTGILEIRMGMGTKTEKAYKGMHSIRMAIYGVEGKVYSSLEELYAEKTGLVADTDDINKMKQAIRGETSIGNRRAQAKKEEERRASGKGGRYSEKPEEVNKFKIRYNSDDPNAQLDGYIIPVASINPDTGAYTYGDSGKIFYMENPIGIDSIVRVSCSCSSYFFTFSWYNYAHGVHLGQQPAPYPGKADYSETKLNIYKKPGMCKHLMMFTMLLLNGGIISKEGTNNFNTNLQLIRNRAEKLAVPRKLADNSDWGNHLRNLNQMLFRADKMRRAQYTNSTHRLKFLDDELDKVSPDGYYDWSQHKVSSRKVSGFKGNPRKGLNRDVYTDQGGRDAFGDIMNMLKGSAYGDEILNIIKRSNKGYDDYGSL